MHNLLAFLVKYNHWLVFLLLEVVSGVMLFKYNSYQGSAWFSSANYVAGTVSEWQADIEKYFSLALCNEQLTRRNVFLEQEVGRLRRLLSDAHVDTTDLMRSEQELLSQYQVIPAKVVSNSVSSFNNLITIDKGKADGVETDMGVACGNGLVGVVYLVNDHYSVVIPVLNYQSHLISVILLLIYYYSYYLLLLLLILFLYQT